MEPLDASASILHSSSEVDLMTACEELWGVVKRATTASSANVAVLAQTFEKVVSKYLDKIENVFVAFLEDPEKAENYGQKERIDEYSTKEVKKSTERKEETPGITGETPKKKEDTPGKKKKGKRGIFGFLKKKKKEEGRVEKEKEAEEGETPEISQVPSKVEEKAMLKLYSDTEKVVLSKRVAVLLNNVCILRRQVAELYARIQKDENPSFNRFQGFLTSPLSPSFSTNKICFCSQKRLSWLP